jgi:hypothetical protein
LTVISLNPWNISMFFTIPLKLFSPPPHHTFSNFSYKELLFCQVVNSSLIYCVLHWMNVVNSHMCFSPD